MNDALLYTLCIDKVYFVISVTGLQYLMSRPGMDKPAKRLTLESEMIRVRVPKGAIFIITLLQSYLISILNKVV